MLAIHRPALHRSSGLSAAVCQRGGRTLGSRGRTGLAAAARLLDGQKQAKSRDSTEHGLERAFNPQQAERPAFADEAPRLEAAAQRIGGKREPLHGRDAQRRKEAVEPLPLAGGEKRRNGLVGVVRIAAWIRTAVAQHIDRGANRLVMQQEYSAFTSALFYGWGGSSLIALLLTLAGKFSGVLGKLGVPLSTVRTNWRRQVCIDWEAEFGACLASSLHQFSSVASVGVIGADEDYSHLEFPWGSNPITNPMLSGADFEILTEGGLYTRTGRVNFLSSTPDVVASLHVCWKGLTRSHRP